MSYENQISARTAEEILEADRACARAAQSSGPRVSVISPEAVAILGAPVAGLPALLILSLAEARDLAADLIAAITT